MKHIFKKELEDGILLKTEGTRYLGAPIGSDDFKRGFFKERLNTINEKIRKLNRLCKTSPHSAYHLYTRSVKHELTYLQRVGLDENETEETVKCVKGLVEVMVGR